MLAAHRYRNQLVELELRRRKEVHQAVLNNCAEYAAALRAFAEAKPLLERAQIAGDTGPSPSVGAAEHSPPDADAGQSEFKIIPEPMKSLWAAAIAKPAVRTALANVAAAHKLRLKLARAECQCYWGTYLLVERSASDMSKRREPRFSRWQGNGAIAVQLQGGVSTSSLCSGEDTRLAITRLPGGGQNRRDQELRVRVGSCGRSPIWAKFRIRLHRPLADPGVVKWCRVARKLIGTQVHWYATFTIEEPRVPAAPLHNLVAVWSGIRMLGNGDLCVAAWNGSDGGSGRLIISKRELSTLRHIDKLRTNMDVSFEIAKRRLSQWVVAARLRGHNLPPWLECAVRQLHNWRSHQHFAGFIERWRANGFAGDQCIVKYLSWWRVSKDRHLRNWVLHRQSRLLGNRDEMYRVFAAKMRKQYGYIRLAMATYTEGSEQDNASTPKDAQFAIELRDIRFAALSRLKKFLVEAFGPCTNMCVGEVVIECQNCGLQTEARFSYCAASCCRCSLPLDVDFQVCQEVLASAPIVIQNTTK